MPVKNRIFDKEVDTSILGEKVQLPFSGLVAPNRFLKAPMTETLSTWDQKNIEKCGVPTAKLIRTYERWGEGEIGINVSGNIMIHSEHLEAPGNAILENNNDGRVEEFRKLAKAAKKHGSIFIGQISHPGRQTRANLQPNPVSASDITLPPNDMGAFAGKPTPLSKEGIKDVVERFAITSELLYQAGYDGVQLHGAHGYLIAQFLATTTNKRTDEYGGSLENRSRIIFEVIEAIRRRVRDQKFSISMKLNSVEFQTGGFGTEECRELCKKLEDAGVDFVELSGGNYEVLGFEHKKESTKKREAFFLAFADVIRPVLSKTKVYVTGGFRTAPAMIDAIKKGSTDGIGLGRPLASEPTLCKKLLRKDIPVWSAGKTEGLSNQLMQVLASIEHIRQIANDLEPIDISDPEQGAKLQEALIDLMKASKEKDAQGIIEPQAMALANYAVPYEGGIGV